MLEFVSVEALSSFFKVVFIDIALAGDNAIVIAMAAAGLSAGMRRKAILIGIAAAAVLRIIFSSVAVQLLSVVGLSLAGGILLLWVCWRLWRELHPPVSANEESGEQSKTDDDGRSLRQAVGHIILADISMSLDNVLAVAGAARDHPVVLVFGLALSVALMAVAATMISKLLLRYPWIAYLGLAIILYVAVEMIFSGGQETWHFAKAAIASL